jgi:hypothetical protein
MRPARRGLHAALLALALLAAQALGLAHRVAHGLPQMPQMPGSASSAALASAAIAATAARAPTTDTAEAPTALFSAHDPGGIECRLLDQVAHADALAASAWPALPPRVPVPLPVVAGEILAGVGVHAYLARGPPAGLRAGQRVA